jgi:alpha-tubulin suppressor-like RCC1 family protein
LSAGENDNNELGRPGKRSLFNRIDALETFQLIDLAVGDGFVILGNRDGRGIAWGRNDMGQLGIGNRETREKPKLHSILRDGILQVSCGLQHAVALSRRGDIYCWGANKKGQLGDGQLTSSCTPLLLTQLRHRPVVSIACGEGHTIVLTVGGNAYSWGDNTCGQLGTGDTTHRLRPELMRHLRAAKIRQISAGKQHSAIISPSGLLFTFGSNSHGQVVQFLLSNPYMLTCLTTINRLIWNIHDTS